MMLTNKRSVTGAMIESSAIYLATDIDAGFAIDLKKDTTSHRMGTVHPTTKGAEDASTWFFLLKGEQGDLFASAAKALQLSDVSLPRKLVAEFATTGTLPTCIPDHWLLVLELLLSSGAFTCSIDRGQYAGIGNIATWRERYSAKETQGRFELAYLFIYFLHQEHPYDLVLVFNSEDALRSGRFHSMAEIIQQAYNRATVDSPPSPKGDYHLRSSCARRVFLYVHEKNHPYKPTGFEKNDHFSVMVPVNPPSIPYIMYSDNGLTEVDRSLLAQSPPGKHGEVVELLSTLELVSKAKPGLEPLDPRVARRRLREAVEEDRPGSY